MDHGPDVGPIDAHAEGVGGHDHVQIAGGEAVVDLGAGVAGHARVVAGRAPATAGAGGGQAVGGLARARIQDGRAAGPGRVTEGTGELGQGQGAAGLAAVHLAHGQVQVGPGEAAQDHGRGLGGQAELGQDLVAHQGGGRGRAGQHVRRSQGVQDPAEPQVVGPEVVAPLGDAVGLVDGDQLGPHGCQHVQ